MTQNPLEIVLATPFEIGNEFIEVIKLRRPKGKDMKKLSARMETSDLMKLAATLSGHLPVVFDEMDGYDLTRVFDALGNLFTTGPTTGA